MTTNTNSAQERTASIDLDAEREAMFAADPEGMEKVKNAGLVHAAMKGWLAARRSLTSGAAADPMYQAQFDGEYGSSIWHDVTEAAYHTFMPKHRRIVYAAQVHDAAAPSDVQRCKDCGRTGWHVCRYSAGAAAKTEQASIVLCSPFPGMDEPWSQEKLEELDAALSPYELTTAAGAGSAQPRAEGGERALFGFDRDDLEAVADGLESGYEKTIDVGGSPFEEGPNLVASTTAVAAKFIRAALDHGAQAATTASAQVPDAWMLEFDDERVVTTDPNEVEAWVTQHDNPYTPIPLYRAALARAPLPVQGGAQPVYDARDAARWQFMMAVADDPDGEAAERMNDASKWSDQTHGNIYQDKRPGSTVVTEIVDRAMRANDGAGEGGNRG